MAYGRTGSSPVIRTKRTEQFRCRGLNAYGINCFRDFYPLKILKPNDRCQRAILSVWRGLNPHTKDTKKGAKHQSDCNSNVRQRFILLKMYRFRVVPFFK